MAIACIAMSPTQGDAEGAVAAGHLAVTSSDRMFDIAATVESPSPSPLDVTATLSVTKNDTSGNVTTNQSKNIQISKGNPVEIARTGVSMDTSGRLVVSLTITDGNAILDQVTYTIERNTSE